MNRKWSEDTFSKVCFNVSLQGGEWKLCGKTNE